MNSDFATDKAQHTSKPVTEAAYSQGNSSETKARAPERLSEEFEGGLGI